MVKWTSDRKGSMKVLIVYSSQPIKQIPSELNLILGII
jgi:hypothetical protein